MCLLAVAWQIDARFPFVFAGNRDEYHARPSAAANWWPDAPEVLGGRDLQAGGSWLGISRSGRFAVVTNRPELPAPDAAALSRGDLVAQWLKATGKESASGVRASLERTAASYGGFSLLTATLERGSGGKLVQFGGGNQAGALAYDEVSAGVSGLSNTAPDKPWPKLTWLNGELDRLLRTGNVDTEQLFALLRREDPVPGTLAKGVSARPFVIGTEYGTRCSTVITVDAAGLCRFAERRFGPGGKPAGESAFEFLLAH